MATAAEYAAWIVANKDKKGTPEFETVARAYKQARARRSSFPPPPAPYTPSEEFMALRPESSVGGEFMRGIESLLSNYRTAAGTVFGNPEDTARAAMARNEAMGEKYGEGPSFARVSDKFTNDGLMSAAGEVARQLPQAAAGQAGLFGAMGLGALAGQALIPVPLVGAGIGAGLAMIPQFIGSDAERQAEVQTEAGQPLDIDVGKAVTAGILQSIPEVASRYFVLGNAFLRPLLKVAKPEELTGRLALEATQKLVSTAQRSLKGTLGRGVVKGAAVEMPTEIAQQVIERAQAGLDVLSPDAIAEYGEAAYLAGLVGGALGTVGGVSTRSDARRQLKAYEEQSKAAIAAENERRDSLARMGRGETEQLDMLPPDTQVVGPLEPADARASRMAGTEETIPLLIDRGDDLSQYSNARRKAIEEGRTFQYEAGAESDLNQLDMFREDERAQRIRDSLPPLALPPPQGKLPPPQKRLPPPTFRVSPEGDVLTTDDAELQRKLDAERGTVSAAGAGTSEDIIRRRQELESRQASRTPNREMFDAEEAPIPEPPPNRLTADFLKAIGIRSRNVIEKVAGRDLRQPKQLQAVVDALTAEAIRVNESNSAYASSANPRNNVSLNITRLLSSPPFSNVTASGPATTATDTAFPSNSRQVGIEEVIEADKERQERDEVQAAQDAVARVAELPPGTPNTMQGAMQKAERTGRRVPGQAQLEIPTIPSVDPTIAGIAEMQRKIETKQAQQPDNSEGPVQGTLIGPRGGTRGQGRMRPEETPTPTPEPDVAPTAAPETTPTPSEAAAPEAAAPETTPTSTPEPDVAPTAAPTNDPAAAAEREAARAKRAQERAAAKRAAEEQAAKERKAAMKAEERARKAAKAKADKETPPVDEADTTTVEEEVAPEDVEAAAVAAEEGDVDPTVTVGGKDTRARNSGESRNTQRMWNEAQQSDDAALAEYMKGNTDIETVMTNIAFDLEQLNPTVQGRALKAARALKESSPNNFERFSQIHGRIRQDKGRWDLPVKDVAQTSLAVSTDVETALRNGSLDGAFDALSRSGNKTISKLAKALRKVVGTTAVRYEADLRNEVGKPIAGTFDPKTNTISLNADFPTTNHVLIHEMLHAATSAELDNMSSPIRQQLVKLFNDVKDRLDTAYGSTDVHEFVAEAFSNPEFQSKLASMDTKGDKYGILERLKDIVKNVIRKLRGLPFQKRESAKDAVDNLVSQMLSPAPEYRDAARMNSATMAGRARDFVEDVGKFATGEISAEDVREFNDYMPTATRTTRNAILNMLPLDAIGRYVEPQFPELTKEINELFKVIQRKNGARQNFTVKVKDTARQWENVFKGKAELRDRFNHAVHESTRWRTDPSKPRKYYEQYHLSYYDADYNHQTGGGPFNTKAERDAEVKRLTEIHKTLNGPDSKFIYRTQDPTESQLQVYDRLRREIWDPMVKMEGGEKAAQVYNQMRDAYETAFKDLRFMLSQRIEALQTSDAGLKQSYRDRILVELLNKESIEPYFPLYRKGDFWVKFNAKDPFTGEIKEYQEAFESDPQRQARIRELAADPDVEQGSVNRLDRPSSAARRKDPFAQIDSRWGYSLLSDVKLKSDKRIQEMADKLREQNKSDEEIKKAVDAAKESNRYLQRVVLDALIDAMPERSLHRAFTRRKGTHGERHDAISVFRDRMPSFLGQLANIEYDVPLSEARANILKAPAKYKDSDQEYARQIAEHAAEYTEFVRNPQLSNWSRWTKSLGFMWTLGINASSAVVNTMIMPMVVLPYLGGKYGYANTIRAMVKAGKMFFSTGTRRALNLYDGVESGTMFDGPGFQHLDFDDPSSVPEVFRSSQDEMMRNQILVEVMKARSMGNISIVEDILDMADPNSTLLTKVNTIMGWMFHQGERFNRQVTMKATYDLILDKKLAENGGKPLTEADYRAAADEAALETEHTNSGAMTETAPRVAQNDLGSVLLMYKRFGVSMYFLQFSMARNLIKDAKTKGFLKTEEAKIAKKQIAGLFATSGMLAGMQGLPLYGVISAIGNMFFLDDEDDDFDSIAAAAVGEGLYSGVLNAAFGTDVAPRIGMSNLIFRTLPNRDYEDWMAYAMELGGGPVFGIAERIRRGVDLMAEGEISRGLEGVLPSGLANMKKAFRYGDEGGATTLRGDFIVEDMSPLSLAGQFLGFAPAGYTRQMSINARDKRIDRRLNEKSTGLLRKRYQAIRDSNYDELNEIDAEIEEFNLRHPESAITLQTKRRSLAQHYVTTEVIRRLNGITVNPRRTEALVRKRLEELGESEYFF